MSVTPTVTWPLATRIASRRVTASRSVSGSQSVSGAPDHAAMAVIREEKLGYTSTRAASTPGLYSVSMIAGENGFTMSIGVNTRPVPRVTGCRPRVTSRWFGDHFTNSRSVRPRIVRSSPLVGAVQVSLTSSGARSPTPAPAPAPSGLPAPPPKKVTLWWATNRQSSPTVSSALSRPSATPVPVASRSSGRLPTKNSLASPWRLAFTSTASSSPSSASAPAARRARSGLTCARPGGPCRPPATRRAWRRP